MNVGLPSLFCYPCLDMTWLRVPLPSLLALALGSGCQNNTIQLEFESAPSGDSDDSGGAGTTGDETGQVMTATIGDADTSDTEGPSGNSYLLAISTPLDPSLPFQGIVTINESPGQVEMSLQWLSLSLGSRTEPRQPVGDTYYYTIPVDETGFIYWDFGPIVVPAAANPITGMDLSAAVLAGATPVGDPAYCGEVAGSVTSPIALDLAGSTHAMTEVGSISSLPVDFLSSCP